MIKTFRHVLTLVAAGLLVASWRLDPREPAKEAVQPAPAVEVVLPKLRAMGVEILWQHPLEKRKDLAKGNPHSVPVRDVYLARAVSFLYEELQRYPAELVAEHVKRVYMYDRFSLYGIPAAGTWGTHELFLATGDMASPGRDRFFRTTVHHELSSMLLRYEDFPVAAWRAANAPELIYLLEQRNGFAKKDAATREGAAQEVTSEALDQGLIHNYGATDMENDVNTYVELLLMDRDRLQQLASRHPRVARKCQILAEFYRGLNVAVEGCSNGR